LSAAARLRYFRLSILTFMTPPASRHKASALPGTRCRSGSRAAACGCCMRLAPGSLTSSPPALLSICRVTQQVDSCQPRGRKVRASFMRLPARTTGHTAPGRWRPRQRSTTRRSFRVPLPCARPGEPGRGIAGDKDGQRDGDDHDLPPSRCSAQRTSPSAHLQATAPGAI